MTTQRLKLREGAAAWRELNGETIVFDFSTSKYLATNASGSILWEAIADGTTHESLVGRLVEVYNIDRALAATAVDTFIDAVRAHNLLAEP